MPRKHGGLGSPFQFAIIKAYLTESYAYLPDRFYRPLKLDKEFSAMRHTSFIVAALFPLLLTACGGEASDHATPSMLKKTGHQTRASEHSLTATQYTPLLQQVYLAFFGRPADPAGLQFFAGALSAGGAPESLGAFADVYGRDPTVTAVIDSFASSPESEKLYAGDNAAFITAIYRSLFNRVPDVAGKAFWTSAMDRGAITRGNAVLAIMGGALASDRTILEKKLNAATRFTQELSSPFLSGAYSGYDANAVVREMLSTVSDTTNMDLFANVISATISRLASPERKTCNATTQYDQVNSDFVFGDYRVRNDMWGVLAGFVSPATAFTQCMSSAQISEDAIKMSWQWQFAHDAKVTGLSGYPGVIYGWNPGEPKSTNAVLPAPVTALAGLEVEYDMSITSTGYVQTFFDLYFTSGPAPSLATMTHEVSISIRAPQWVGAHTRVGSPLIDGQQYDVYVGKTSLPHANAIIWVSRKDHLSGRLRLDEIVAYMVSKGLVSQTEYLSSIEFGTEPSGGEGAVNVSSYRIVKPTAMRK